MTCTNSDPFCLFIPVRERTLWANFQQIGLKIVIPNLTPTSRRRCYRRDQEDKSARSDRCGCFESRTTDNLHNYCSQPTLCDWQINPIIQSEICFSNLHIGNGHNSLLRVKGDLRYLWWIRSEISSVKRLGPWSFSRFRRPFYSILEDEPDWMVCLLIEIRCVVFIIYTTFLLQVHVITFLILLTKLN